MTDGEILALEEGAHNGWPALVTEAHGGWLWRFSDGYSKRANSVLPLYTPGSSDADPKVREVEAAYQRAALPPVFKIPGHGLWNGLDALLADLGYEVVDPSAVLSAPLPNLTRLPIVAEVPGFLVDDAFSLRWFEGMFDANAVAPAHRSAAQSMASRVSRPLVGSLAHEGRPVAWAYVALVGDQAWLFDVVVQAEYRNRGLAKRLVQGLLQAGAAAGARTAYLQVMETNAPALGVYRRLGFTEAYRYWYRRKVSSPEKFTNRSFSTTMLP